MGPEEVALATPTPADVADWSQRRATALVPLELDARGWPLHPHGRSGRTGRNLGKWGENAAADPIVVAGSSQERRVPVGLPWVRLPGDLTISGNVGAE